jgi:shikimate 5-dehydrogenase
MSPQPSLILVGRRGSGLSSFAVIAARLIGFGIIDVDARFISEHGMSRAACLRVWGEQRYRETAARFMTDLLSHHEQDHVLVCASEAADPNAQSLVSACDSSTPVIMVSRDKSAVRRHLGLTNCPETQRILSVTQQLCRRASNVEFYNLSEDQGPQDVSDVVVRALRSQEPLRHLVKRLRQVTKDVLCFVSLLGYRIGGNEHPNDYNTLDAREFPSYTTVCFQDVLRKASDMVGLDCASDALELLIPYLTVRSPDHEDIELICEAFQILRRHFQLPIIYHVEWAPEFSPAEKLRYVHLSKQGLRLLPEFATIDLRCSDQEIKAFFAARRGQTKLLAHRTFPMSEDFSWRDPMLLEQCRRAAALGCDHVRFLRFAVSPREDRECAAFQATADYVCSIPVSAANIDKFSRSSAVSNTGLTPVSQPLLSPSHVLTLLPTSHELTRARFSSFLFRPLHFHIYGASVDYSLSPAMHNVAFETLGMGHSYSSRQSATLEDVKHLFDETFGGASISLPFKSAVMDLLDTISEPARIIQAVNTIVPRRGKVTLTAASPVNAEKNRAGNIVGLHGDNTDWVALRVCILRQLSAANSVNASTTALVIGAGGMARASVYAFMSLGIKNIVIWNRTLSRAELMVTNYTKYISGLIASDSLRRTQFRILENLTDPWPADMKQPSVIVCTPPAHSIGDVPGLDFTVPSQWFGSPTGGVIVEVSFPTWITGFYLTVRAVVIQVKIYVLVASSIPQCAQRLGCCRATRTTH